MATEKRKYANDTFVEYLSDPAISSSDIKAFLKSPRTFYFEKYERETKEAAQHFTVGSALHCLVLTPELFDDGFFVSKKFDQRTKVGKDAAKEVAKQSAGKEILFEEDFVMIKKMADSARKNKTLMELSKNSHFEMSIYGEDEVTGIKTKIRPDVYAINRPTLIDLKTCLDSGIKKFRHDIFNFGYNITSSWYSKFSGKENYLFAAIEKQEPYQTSLFTLSSHFLNHASEQIRMALDCMLFCQTHNVWPDYSQFELMKRLYSIDMLDSYFEQVEENNNIILIE